MNWFDRVLLVIEVLVLLKMLQMDKANSKAIQRFLSEREKWYARRAHIKTMLQGTSDAAKNEKALQASAGEPILQNQVQNEIVTVLEESENEQVDEQSENQSENL